MAAMIFQHQLFQYYEGFKNMAGDRKFIDSRQLMQLLRDLGFTPSQNQIRQIKSKIGIPEESKIFFQDFLFILARRFVDKDTQDQIRKVFSFFDNDKDELISAKDLKFGLAKLGQSLSNQEIDQIILQNDRNGDGYLDFEEFLRCLMSR